MVTSAEKKEEGQIRGKGLRQTKHTQYTTDKLQRLWNNTGKYIRFLVITLSGVLLMRVKEESEKAGLKFNIQKN